MNAMPRSTLAYFAVLVLAAPSASAQGNPCSLLTSAEAVTHIARGQKTYGQTPDAVAVAGGALCEYPFGGQVGLWSSMDALERFLKVWKADKAARHAVSGVGDRAWIIFPVPEDEYKDRTAYLAAQVGARVLTVALHARKGAADGPMGQVCRGDQKRLKPDERADCLKILADKSETQESLQPAAVELARLLVPRVRAGKGA
jgi:hypothetical protein